MKAQYTPYGFDVADVASIVLVHTDETRGHVHLSVYSKKKRIDIRVSKAGNIVAGPSINTQPIPND